MIKNYYWNYCIIEELRALVACDEDHNIVWMGFIPTSQDHDFSLMEMKKDLGLSAVYEQNSERVEKALLTPKVNFVSGTELQRLVWAELLKIPLGTTVSYSDIAKAVNKPKAVRAVGTAIGKNFISYFVPCHRVIRKDGSYQGYRWGTDIKRILLNREKLIA